MSLRHAVGLPNVGVFGSVPALVELAVLAEHSGWDGVHLWDHLLFHEPEWPVASPIATAAAVAAATQRVRIVLTLTLPRRQVQDVAQDTAGIAALAGGRLTVLGIIGSMDREFTEFGLDPDLKARGRALDERLARLQELWRQWGAPEIPLWCGGRWPRKPGLRRAARFDGVLLTFADQRNSTVPVETFADAVGFVRGLAGNRPFDIAVEGATEPGTAAGHIAPYAAAGATWWVEAMGWWRGDLATAHDRITAGPPPEEVASASMTDSGLAGARCGGTGRAGAVGVRLQCRARPSQELSVNADGWPTPGRRARQSPDAAAQADGRARTPSRPARRTRQTWSSSSTSTMSLARAPRSLRSAAWLSLDQGASTSTWRSHGRGARSAEDAAPDQVAARGHEAVQPRPAAPAPLDPDTPGVARIGSPRPGHR
jgi:hypothetical protein